MRKIMKMILFCLGILLFLISGDAAYAQSIEDDGTYLVKEIFTDEKMAAAVARDLGLGVNDVVTQEELDEMRYFSLEDSEITDLNGIQYLRKLENLYIQNAAITTLELVSELDSLRRIEIRGVQTLTSLSGLSSLPALKQIDVENCSITKIGEWDYSFQLTGFSAIGGVLEDIQGLSGQNALTAVKLYENNITSLKALAKAAQLRTLEVRNNQIVSLDGLENKGELTCLYASNNKINDISAIKDMAELVTVDLSYNQISDASGFSANGKVLNLNLSNNQLENIDFLTSFEDVFGGWGSLNLSNNQISSLNVLGDIYKTVSYTGFEQLNLSNNNINSLLDLSFLANGGDSAILSSLDVSGNQLASLAGLNGSKIKTLNASYNPIADIEALGSINGLDEIIISHGALTYDAVIAVDWSKYESLWIRSIDFSYNQIENAGELYAILMEKGISSKIIIAGNQINNFDFIKDGWFDHLDLSGTDFKDISILKDAKQILSLDISNNGLTDAHMEDWASMGDLLWNMHALNLSDNELTSLGFLNVYNDDKMTGYLTVDANNNKISSLDSRAIDFLDGYKGTSLSLYLKNNGIEDISGFAGQKYAYNLNLDLSKNHISDSSPLYENFSTAFGEMGSGGTFNVDMLDQTITDAVVITDTDFVLTRENKIRGLDSKFIEPSYISHGGSYQPPYLSWDTAKLPDSNSGTVIYKFYISISERGAARAAAIPGTNTFNFSGEEVAVNYRIEKMKYTVTYFGNGNTGGSVPVDMLQYEAGEKAKVLKSGNLENSGHSFKEWNTDATGRGDQYSVGSVIGITGNINLYAIWEKDSIPESEKYTVTYYGNGNTGGNVPKDLSEYEAGDKATVLDAEGLIKEGFTFHEWNTNAFGTGKRYILGDELVMEGNIDLYAVWEEESLNGQPDPEKPDPEKSNPVEPDPKKGKGDIKDTLEPKKLNNSSSAWIANTGDETNIFWWLCIMAAAVLVVVLLGVIRKRSAAHQGDVGEKDTISRKDGAIKSSIPFRNLVWEDIQDVLIEIPPEQGWSISEIQITEFIELLNEVVIYEQVSTENLAEKTFRFCIVKLDGSKVIIEGLNQYLIINDVWYRAGYESCEALNRFAVEVIIAI